MHKNINNIIKEIAEKSDKNAFKEFYRIYFPGLFSFACSILKDKHNAEDVMEDVFLYVWEHRYVLSTVRNVASYLNVTTKNACLNFLQHRDLAGKGGIVDPENLGSGISFRYTSNNAFSDESCNKINAVIDSLPPKRKLVFKLIKDDGLSYKEVASLLEISEKTVENQMLVAFKQLINALSPQFPEFRSYFNRASKKNRNAQ